ASLWVKPSHETSHDQQLFSKQDGSDDDVNFNLSIPADSLQVEFDLQGSNCSSALGPLTSGGELIEDQWNHIVATFDNENLVLYINFSFR
ncbi:MAG: LamG domain-containing protein, partial [bacterium]|nr:LamG domain-containing protein [bacterium]